MIIYCDLGGYRLTRCEGTYENGFRPVERVIKKTPKYYIIRKNKEFRKQYIKNYAAWYAKYKTLNFHKDIFPYPDSVTLDLLLQPKPHELR